MGVLPDRAGYVVIVVLHSSSSSSSYHFIRASSTFNASGDLTKLLIFVYSFAV
jgi:hypothetical protein